MSVTLVARSGFARARSARALTTRRRVLPPPLAGLGVAAQRDLEIRLRLVVVRLERDRTAESARASRCSASWSCASESALAKLITPSNVIARERRHESASCSAIAAISVRASFRRSASRGSED